MPIVSLVARLLHLVVVWLVVASLAIGGVGYGACLPELDGGLPQPETVVPCSMTMAQTGDQADESLPTEQDGQNSGSSMKACLGWRCASPTTPCPSVSAEPAKPFAEVRRIVLPPVAELVGTDAIPLFRPPIS